jgi:hypothetical protein
MTCPTRVTSVAHRLIAISLTIAVHSCAHHSTTTSSALGPSPTNTNPVIASPISSAPPLTASDGRTRSRCSGPLAVTAEVRGGDLTCSARHCHALLALIVRSHEVTPVVLRSVRMTHPGKETTEWFVSSEPLDNFARLFTVRCEGDYRLVVEYFRDCDQSVHQVEAAFRVRSTVDADKADCRPRAGTWGRI